MSMPLIHSVSSIDSTNAEALRLLNNGERGPLWIHADQQTSGRGRSGREWISEPGNLFASYLIVFPAGSSKAYQVSLLTGVAVHGAILDVVGSGGSTMLQLKWPNDILIGAQKTGGILVESTNVDGKALAVIIGIGVNLVSHPDDDVRPATHLNLVGVAPSPDVMLKAIDVRLTEWLARWAMGQGFQAVREAWLQRAHPIGTAIAVNGVSGPVVGHFAGLDEDGALLITVANGQTQVLHYGDVTLGA
jgi:BirA family transcriptional regulator, biotin operon repressor / biotin---[acetyl-CoA-carboxylase] ligase